ncbi:MAG: hypothetical protein OXF49_03210 [Candidatus Saccharibacteria bacterium]|nr:hypothetical protein [Candidatus Saccharibacteria bacterium]MCY4089105.1 hypothetical protein [Candidatus Saccharibacteria bacterium]
MAEIPDKQLERFRNLVGKANTALQAAEELLTSIIGDDFQGMDTQRLEEAGKVIEGVFNGQNMVADDGKIFPIQANYASKSRLVQGDRMKLTISDNGSFTYKQIGPIERTQVIGLLSLQDGRYYVQVGSKRYQVLIASVTHHKVKQGDQISITIPQDNPDAEWAAIESPL